PEMARRWWGGAGVSDNSHDDGGGGRRRSRPRTLSAPPQAAWAPSTWVAAPLVLAPNNARAGVGFANAFRPALGALSLFTQRGLITIARVPRFQRRGTGTRRRSWLRLTG